MPFDCQPTPQDRPERPQRCDCLILFGIACYDDQGVCLECGGTNVPPSMRAPDLKALIVELAQVGFLSQKAATDLIEFYGLRGA